MSTFEIYSVNEEKSFKENLIVALKHFQVDHVLEKIEDRFHFRYFLNYIHKEDEGLRANTILVENYYTSLSYQNDYLNYYAHCYTPYSKNCIRVHFFKETFNKETFIKYLLEKDTSESKKVWDSYLGYIIVKPLPRGIIGATLLEPYTHQGKDRYYTAIREYPINLFGKELKVKSLPYQEQDGIVGSCASSALWFCFQKTNELFGTATPSPSEITISAGYDSYHTGKNFPSSGLEISQICKAITANGLVAELLVSNVTGKPNYFLNDEYWLKSFIYSYLKMGVPVLLGIDIENTGHLVTVNGYRFMERDIDYSERIININLVSDNIAKFYAHDDQLGPFSRLDIINEEGYNFRTSWWENISSNKELLAKASCIIAPIKSIIKVSYQNILEECIKLDGILELFIAVKFTWDIYLAKSNDYKVELRTEFTKNNFSIDFEEAKEIFFTSLPEYIWVARAQIKVENTDYLIFDVVYDAIDLNFKTNPFVTTIFNSDFEFRLREHGLKDTMDIFNKKRSSSDGIFKSISKEQKDAKNQIENYLEQGEFSYTDLVKITNDETRGLKTDTIILIQSLTKEIQRENKNVADEVSKLGY